MGLVDVAVTSPFVLWASRNRKDHNWPCYLSSAVRVRHKRKNLHNPLSLSFCNCNFGNNLFLEIAGLN